MAKRRRHSPPDVSETDVLTTEHEVEVSPHADLIAEIKPDQLYREDGILNALEISSERMRRARKTEFLTC